MSEYALLAAELDKGAAGWGVVALIVIVLMAASSKDKH